MLHRFKATLAAGDALWVTADTCAFLIGHPEGSAAFVGASALPMSAGSSAKGASMPRRRSLTRQLYRVARNLRAADTGPAYGKRDERRKVYGRSMGATGKLLRLLGPE